MRKTTMLLLVLFCLAAIPALAVTYNPAGAVVAAKAAEAVVGAVSVRQLAEETVKDPIVIDNNAPIKDGVTLPLINISQNTKVLLGRGQNLSYIAWKYTGNSDNWKLIAQASGLKLDLKSQKRVFVGTVLVIPQELLKPELKPAPSAYNYSVAVKFVDHLWDSRADLQKNLADARWWMWYWTIVSMALAIVSGVALVEYFGEKNLHNFWSKEAEHYKKWANMLPGSPMKFKTREGKVITAMIMKVEFVEGDGHYGEPAVTEVKCLAPTAWSKCDTARCGTRVHPKNFLSHYFQQHPAPVS